MGGFPIHLVTTRNMANMLLLSWLTIRISVIKMNNMYISLDVNAKIENFDMIYYE